MPRRHLRFIVRILMFMFCKCYPCSWHIFKPCLTFWSPVLVPPQILIQVMLRLPLRPSPQSLPFPLLCLTPLHLLSPRTLPLYPFLPLHHNLLNFLTHPRPLYHHQISLPLHLPPQFTHTSPSHLQTHPTALLPNYKLPVKHHPLPQLPIQLSLLNFK